MNWKWTVLLFFLVSFNQLVHGQYDKERAFVYLQEIYNRYDKDLREYLLLELNEYLSIFPDNDHAADIQFMIADIYREKGDDHEALAALLKTILLYPGNIYQSECVNAIRSILDDKDEYDPYNDMILDLIANPPAKTSHADAFYAYIDLLNSLETEKLYDWNLKTFHDFIQTFPKDNRLDQVSVWLADLYVRMEEYAKAEASYFKVPILFPASPFIPYSYYKRGTLLYEELDKDDLAVEVLTRHINEYPADTLSATSYYLIGKINQEERDEYKDAVIYYKRFVEKFPGHEWVIDAWWNIGKINKDELDDYPAAILAYGELVKVDSLNQKGVDALEEMSDLYKDKLKDYENAAASLARIAKRYPDYDKAPDRLIDAGEILENKKDDYQKAISYYQQVLDMYPDHDKVNDAQEKIEKAKAKLENQ